MKISWQHQHIGKHASSSCALYVYQAALEQARETSEAINVAQQHRAATYQASIA